MPGRSLAWRVQVASRWLSLLAIGLPAPLTAQTIVATANLSFGAFLSGSGGTVIVSPDGSRSKTGSVLLLSQGSGVAAAQFSISGTADASYAISLPGDNSVTLADGNLHTLAVNGFTSSPSGSGRLSGGGTQWLGVGATLVVGSGQAAGSYTGSFSVTVNYQ
jgi:hypothetical protein